MVFVSTDKLAIYSIYLVFLDLGLIKEVDWILFHNMCKTIIKTSKYPFSWSSSPYRRQAEKLSPHTLEFVSPCPSFHPLNFYKLQRSKNIFAFFVFVEHFVCKERRHSSGPNQYFIGRLEKRDDVNEEMRSDRKGNLLLCVWPKIWHDDKGEAVGLSSSQLQPQMMTSLVDS